MRTASRVLFPTDEPLAAEEMIGRREDVDELVAQLSAGVHRILAAPRRTGKSTVARAVIAQLDAQGLYTVQVSLFELTTAAALAERLAQRALANRGALARLIARVRAGGEAVLKGAALTLSVKASMELGDGVELALRPGLAAHDPEAAVGRALQLLETVAQHDDRRLVLFIDELQEIIGGDYGDGEQLTKQLREILARSPHVTCLFCGSVEHLMRGLFTNRHRALYGFGGFHDLAPISAQEWYDGLSSRLARDAVTASSEGLGRVIATGRGHPRATMLVAQQAHVVLVQEGARRLDLVAAERGYEGAMAAERARHADALLDVRRLGPTALRVLVNIATNGAPYRGVEAKASRRALDALARTGIVVRGSGRGAWSITDPLFVDYLARTNTTR